MPLTSLRDGETELVGSWVATQGGVVGDETCKRIEELIEHSFQHIADHSTHGAWQSLFRNPVDGRFWERSYPQGHLQGGGPPALREISEAQARSSYAW